MDIRTHEKIDHGLCGRPLLVEEGRSRVLLKAGSEMAVDDSGLVHGGFVFGLADYAAMIAVNHPNVVLGAAEVKFLKPVQVGDEVVAEATVTSASGKKRIVAVKARKAEQAVFDGTFTCFVLDQHVLT